MSDNLSFMLYVAVLAILLISQISWPFALAAIIIILAIILNKSDIEKKIKSDKMENENLINAVAERLLNLSEKIDETRINAEKNLIGIENKIIEFRDEYKSEIDSSYRDLARRLSETENKLETIKKTVGTAVGVMEDRIEEVEEEVKEAERV